MVDKTVPYRANVDTGYVDAEDVGGTPGTQDETLILELAGGNAAQFIEDLGIALDQASTCGRHPDHIDRLRRLHAYLKEFIG